MSLPGVRCRLHVVARGAFVREAALVDPGNGSVFGCSASLLGEGRHVLSRLVTELALKISRFGGR